MITVFVLLLPVFGLADISVTCEQENIFDSGDTCGWPLSQTGTRCCCWCPDPTGAHAYGHVMDFGKTVNGGNVSFEIRPGAGDANCTTTGYMYYSDDGSNWIPFWSRDNLSGWTTYADTANISDDFRYIRANTNGCSVDWSKVEISGPPDLTSGLVAYWSFDNCDATDNSGNGHNGTIYGNPQCVDGEKGKAFSFDGVANYVEVPHSDSLNPTESITISLWAKELSDSPAYSSLIYKAGGEPVGWCGDRVYSLWTRSDKGIHFTSTPEGSSNQVTCDSAGGLYGLNEFVHVVGVIDTVNHTMSTYVNGNKVSSCEYYGDQIRSGTYPLRIGGHFHYMGDQFNFNGTIDEVRIYNRALSEAEIKALYGVLVDSGAEWRYSETEQAGWTEISFDDSQWNTGITPFDDHSVTGWCDFGGNGTNWPLNTSLYLRKDIDVTQQGDLTVRIAIDNDFVLYFDGNEVAALNSEGCAYKWQYEYNIPSVNAGTHTVAVKIMDRGDDNGFDLMVSQGEAPPPPPTCIYTYSDWGDCQPDNTQTRTVLTATPDGCTGTPVLSQSCTYVPPSDGSSILITKYAKKSQINSGAQAIFNITIENNGKTPLVNIEVKDDQCDELIADKKNNNNYLAIGDKLKYTCVKKYVTHDLTNIAAVKAVSINGTVVTSSATATIKVDNFSECDPSLYENICNKEGQVVTGFYILSKKESKKYDCNYGGYPDIVVIDKQIMPNGDIKCIEQGIVGDINSDCLGRCGAGCGWDLFDERYTQECLNHDLCTRSTGQYLGPCKTEFDIAQEGWTCAEECPE